MNAMMRFTLQSLRANRVRTLVTIAGVALAAALLTAVLTSYTSLQSTLYRTEAAIAGAWMAMVEEEDGDRLNGQLEAALADGAVGDAATVQDAGFGALTEEQQNYHGIYLPLASFSGNIGELCAVKPSSGRLPQAEGEIMLFGTWRTYGDGVALGDTITLPVGQRVARSAPGKTAAASSEPLPSAESGKGSSAAPIEDGSVLDSSIGYLDAEADGGTFNEELVDLEERTYTVVGFYDTAHYAASQSTGMTGFVGGSGPATGAARAFVTVPDADSSAAVQERVEQAFPEGCTTLHGALLRYAGIPSDSAIWDTFFNIVAILAVVIIAACVSLIYNAFAISVAERTRQFALLASVGASQRQRRYAVLTEALAVALVGIPLGVALGIGGCAATFAALGPSLAAILTGGGDNAGFTLTVAPWALGLAGGLTLVTVMLSAYLPALRASRVNVVDALRGNQSTRASQKGAALATRDSRPGRLWRQGGAAGRLFGIGGTLARINGKRGLSKGGTASASLALAIVLLMTAGSLSTFLGTLAEAANGGSTEQPDVTILASLVAEKPTAGEEGLTPEAVAQAADERLAAQAALLTGAYEVLSTVPDAQPQGWSLADSASIIMPETMAGSALQKEGAIEGGPLPDGSYGAMAAISYLDDESFDRFAAEHGLNKADYHDAAHPRAIGISQSYGNDGGVYQLLDVLGNPGPVEVITGALDHGVPITGFMSGYQDGFFAFEPHTADGGPEGDSQGEDAVAWTSAPLEVAALVKEAPSAIGPAGSVVQLIVPVSLASSQGFGMTAPMFRGAFDAPAGQSGEVGDALTERMGTFLHDESEFQTSFLSMMDNAGNRNNNRLMALVVNVFCLLFTVMLTLIALANVFNTVTNSLILRRREFAVMRSVGMSDRQFRSMILEECTAWCVRGLVPGIVLSLAISYLLYRAVTGSMSGLAFALPWTYVALAAALCALAVGASVAYGMKRCKADNVVEALRAE